MPRNRTGKTIARKLLLAFFLIFIITYLVTALLVQEAVRSAVTDSELTALSQQAQFKLDSLNAGVQRLAINLVAWAKLDVMNDLASGDVDKRVQRTLENLKEDYAFKGEIYAFNANGRLIASSDRQHVIGQLPDIWKPQGQISFVNKHRNPSGGGDIVALVTPIEATFSANYRLGTLVIVYRWSEMTASLSDNTFIFYQRPSPESKSLALPDVLLGSVMKTQISRDALADLSHLKGYVPVGKHPYLVESAVSPFGLLSGWKLVMLREPDVINQTVHMVILQLFILGLILALPLTFAISWLASRLTESLRKLTQFVSEITATHDLSKRLYLPSGDEISILANDFNHMAASLENGIIANRIAETRLRATINNALDAVVQINSKGMITGWNEQAVHIFGWSREEAIGQSLQIIIPPQYREEHVQGMQHYLTTGKGRILNSRIEMVSLHRDGHEFPIELAITTIDVEGEHEFSAFIRDITQKKESEAIIWKQANYDKVTGLPNRHMFYDRLEQEIKKSHRDSLQMAILFIDLDHFKEINDTLGHDMGDILLMETSRRIGNCIRETDTVARLGGDEFTVILSEIQDTRNLERLAQCILQALAEPFKLGEEIAYVSASIGITLYPNDANNAEDLIRNADQAMYVAKKLGRNQSSYFTAALQVAAQERRRLTNDLRGALPNNQFTIYFQPIINLATGRIHKAEALIRWQHPERGLINPMGFIPLAEETGLIVEIGDWVFKESARWAKRWRDQFTYDFQISVNVSPVQFLSDELSCDAWSSHLQNMGLSGKNVVIEITEGLLLKAASGVTDKLLKFRDAGIQVAIDDFGTGYSSLSYLKKFDIDYLKIDKSFIDNIESDNNDIALSEAIIVMAHKLGLMVIAEGVENKAQRILLSNAGCDYAQGYLFSKAVPPEEFEALLKASAT